MIPSERQQRPISTDMLTAFVHVAQTRSVSNAAAALSVGKGLISKRIAQLEEKLGIILFSRSSRKIVLTPAGEAYLAYAQRALNEITGGLERVRALKFELTGSLRLTAPVSWGQRVLARHLPSFLKFHPAVEIELILSDRIMDLAAERMDIAFRWSATATGELKKTPIISVPWLLTASAEYLAAHDMPQTPPDLSKHSCLYYRRDSSDDNWVLSCHRVQPERTQEKIPVRVNTRYAVDNAEAVLHAAVAGLGIALLPDYLCETSLRDGSLVRVLPEWTPLTKFGSQIVALITPERMNFSRNKALLDFLLAAVEKEAAPINC